MKTFTIIYNNEILIRKPGSWVSYCISSLGQMACGMGGFSGKVLALPQQTPGCPSRWGGEMGGGRTACAEEGNRSAEFSALT